MAVVKLKEMSIQTMSLRIEGISPLVQHKWSEKAIAQMRDKHAGKKTKNREARDPEAEFHAAMYKMPDGTPAVPAMAIKRCLSEAAHKDLGIEKTQVRKAIFLHADNGLIPLVDYSDPVMREDLVRVGISTTDLRYRPEFTRWAVEILIDFDAEILRVEDIVNLTNRAGYGVGIGEWRPQKNGEWGRFRAATSSK